MSVNVRESYASWSKMFWWETTTSRFAIVSRFLQAHRQTAVRIRLATQITFCVRGVISPLLANLFLHYAFDRWMAKRYPELPFERFADDAIVHCRTELEAQEIRAAIAARLQECGLELHPEKTKVVYCKDDDRRRTYPHEKLDFMGYTFRPRRSKNRKGKFFINFSPAVSDQAVKAIRAEIRSWNLHLRSDKSIEDLSPGGTGVSRPISESEVASDALPVDGRLCSTSS